MQDLILTVRREKASFGIAFDGDGDRIGVVSEDGTVIFGDQLLTLFASEILERKPGSVIITEVKASQIFFDLVKAWGGRPLMWKTGHSLIKQKIKETKAELAGEMSGHVFFSDQYYGFDDAIYAGLRLLEWAQRPENELSVFLKKLPKLESTPELRIDCSDSIKFKVVEDIQNYFSKTNSVNTIDGARIEFG